MIALCGNPNSGKSTAQKILEACGISPIDDGRPLRDVCKIMYGLTEAQVTTQAGKAEYVTVCGETYQVRDLLGTAGKLFEERYSEQILPEAALRIAEEHWASLPAGHRQHGYSFGSVRKVQGLTYRKHSRGVVMEIVRDGCAPSPYDFDQYDRSYVSLTVRNPLPFGVEPDENSVIAFRDEILTAMAAIKLCTYSKD